MVSPSPPFPLKKSDNQLYTKINPFPTPKKLSPAQINSHPNTPNLSHSMLPFLCLSGFPTFYNPSPYSPMYPIVKRVCPQPRSLYVYLRPFLLLLPFPAYVT